MRNKKESVMEDVSVTTFTTAKENLQKPLLQQYQDMNLPKSARLPL